MTKTLSQLSLSTQNSTGSRNTEEETVAVAVDAMDTITEHSRKGHLVAASPAASHEAVMKTEEDSRAVMAATALQLVAADSVTETEVVAAAAAVAVAVMVQDSHSQMDTLVSTNS